MFEDHVPAGVNLKPTWQKTRQVAAVGVQTKPTKSAENEAQAGESASISIQTDSYGLSGSDNHDDATVDWTKLGAFLKSVEPMIVKTLEQNRRQVSLFNAYHSTMNEFDAEVNLHQTLKHADIPTGIQTNAVTWNASGTSLAAAFGCAVHDDWCAHHGWLCVWNVERRVMNPYKAHWSTEMTSCCTCASFHPTNPSLLAAGSYTGEVTVWSLAEEIGETTANGMSGSQQSVTSLNWFGSDLTQPKLITGGSDGRIIVWALPTRDQNLQVISCFQISVGNLPWTLRGKVSSTNRETGISCIQVQRKEEEMFTATTETGAVFYCNLKSHNPVSGNMVVAGSDVPVYDPVVLSLKCHTGPVYQAAGSPFGDRKFATCSADGTVCVRDILKAEPLLDLDLNSGAVFGVSWSPVRPTVLACATAAGKLAILDLSLSMQKPSVWIEGSGTSTLTAVSMNPTRPRFVAAGDSEGVIKVWQLGETFGSVVGDEEKILEQLGASSSLDQD